MPSIDTVRRYVPQLRTALVLTGTGTAGAYHAGVLRALVEAGVKIDLVAGRGIGAVGAMFAAVDSDSRLWAPSGLWRSRGVRGAYRWRPALRGAAWMLAAAFAATLLPVAALVVAVVVLPAGYFLSLVGMEFGVALAATYETWLRAVFAPAVLPVYLPRLVVLAVASLFALLALDAMESVVRPAARRIARGGLWWRLLGAPIDRAQAVAWFSGGLWQIMHGSRVRRPTDDELGERYAELLQENLGQPGFRELLMLVHDVDARRDVAFALLAEPYRGEFLQGHPGPDAAARPLETVDLTRAARRHAMDAFAAALSLPPATDPQHVTFAPDSAWRGETHRFCDRPDSTSRLLDEVARAGVQQAIVVSALPPAAGPHALGAARRDVHGRAGEYLAGLECVSIQEAVDTRRGQFQSLFEVRPEHNPVGPFDVAGCYDEHSDRKQTLGELVDRGREDGLRQFVDAVLGASGELIEAPPAEGQEPPASFSARLASQEPLAD